jgi:6,7-dimethyl-8-ribityllumazine synthase
MEPPGPAFGRPDGKLSEIRDRPLPDFAALHPGYKTRALRVLRTDKVPEFTMVEPRRRKPADEAPLTSVRILIVESGYYEDIADMLLEGAKRALDGAQAAYEVITVPGALEIPQAIAIALDGASGALTYHGVVALGCVIRGETSHYDIVAGESARGLMEIGVGRRIPVGNGILTVDTPAQAKARAALDKGDKGGAAAKAALSLVRLKHGLVSRKPR